MTEPDAALLLGVLLLGERIGGEAYAPDEVESVSQFAHGIGSALDVLSTKEDAGPHLLEKWGAVITRERMTTLP